MTEDSAFVPEHSDLAAVANALDEHRRAGRVIVQCHGVFDLLHPGHVAHLAEAKTHGDILVVTVTPDRFVNKGPGDLYSSRTIARSCSRHSTSSTTWR